MIIGHGSAAREGQKRRMPLRISTAVFTHPKGARRSLCASTYARIAARNCGMLVCDHRLSAFSVSRPKNRSTWFSHDA